MRAIVLVAASTSAVAGAAAGWIVATARPPEVVVRDDAARTVAGRDPAGVDVARIERLERSLDALGESVDRLTTRLGERPAGEPAPSAEGHRPGRAAAPSPPPRVKAFADLPLDDLELEADERHAGNDDNAGAIRRYRELLARGGAPPSVRRWSLHLGDCLARLQRHDEAMSAYSAAYEASDEDSRERYLAIGALAEDAIERADYDAALAWNDRALESQFAEFGAQCRAADYAKAADRTERQRAALTFLIEKYPRHEWCPGWKEWSPGSRGSSARLTQERTMYTPAALIDIHERTHRSLAKLLEHCAALPQPDIDRELAGFGYATVRLQLQHVLGAERYWVGVLHGRMDVDEDDDQFPTIASLASFREQVAAVTQAYLAGASEAELDTPRAMTVWGGKEVVLAPARVILRTQMHVFQHTGQAVAMCRLLGSPAAGLDFPLA